MQHSLAIAIFCTGLCVDTIGCADYRVRALDAETGSIIRNAHVDEGLGWTVEAEGYITDILGGSVIQPPLSPQLSPGFRLYKLPPPHVTIIIPTGYRGPLKIELELAHWVHFNVGRREFAFQATKNGFLHINVTPLLVRAFDNDLVEDAVEARYEDGTRIRSLKYYSDEESDTAVALRPSRHSEFVSPTVTRLLFVVGTFQDEDAVDHTLERPEGDHTRWDREAFNRLFQSQ